MLEQGLCIHSKDLPQTCRDFASLRGHGARSSAASDGAASKTGQTGVTS